MPMLDILYYPTTKHSYPFGQLSHSQLLHAQFQTNTLMGYGHCPVARKSLISNAVSKKTIRPTAGQTDSLWLLIMWLVRQQQTVIDTIFNRTENKRSA